MLLSDTDSPQGTQTPSPDAILTEQNLKAAQNALMGMVLMYTAGGKEMPELLKVGLLIAGVGAVVANVAKMGKQGQP